ncbi:uncharacterized protein METZ01_LOCUS517260, partial [marine metagenome]
TLESSNRDHQLLSKPEAELPLNIFLIDQLSVSILTLGNEEPSSFPKPVCSLSM